MENITLIISTKDLSLNEETAKASIDEEDAERLLTQYTIGHISPNNKQAIAEIRI